MKTPTLNKYESKLIEVNDQLIYFLFSDSELEANLVNLSEKNKDLFTTDVFPENKFSKRLHIKLENLPSLREKSFNTLVGMSHIASVEYMLSYIEEIEKYRSRISTSVYDTISDKKPEEQLKQKLKGWLSHSPDTVLIKTVKYLRLRRNHIAHVREDMSDSFKSIVKNDANFLNKNWSYKTTKLYDFDFANENYSTFSVNEVFALINLTRVCMRLIDEEIISTLNISDIAQYEIKGFLNNKLLNGMTLAKKLRKFKIFMNLRYGEPFTCSEDEYNNYVKNA